MKLKRKVRIDTGDLSSIRDLFAKLQRNAAALEQEVTSDGVFNFVVTGYGLYDDQWLKVCGDLANACKHFILDRRKPVTKSANSARGWGAVRYGKGGYGVGEESIEVQLNDGTSFQCLDLVKNVLATWQSFFKSHGM
jgi:hypothetical protein